MLPLSYPLAAMIPEASEEQVSGEHDADGSIQERWIPAREWEGFEGIIHGGIIGTVLDEAMSKAVAAVGTEALTGELRLRFRHHVEPGEEVRIRGWIVKRTRRLIQTEATLRAADGSERAHAWATFIVLDGKRTEGR